MARLIGDPPFYGTRDGVCIYRRWKKDYVRTKSSLSGKRVKSAPEFKRTMESASFLARASKIASGIYSQMEVKNFPLYRQLTGQAMKMLKAGMEDEEVRLRLVEQWGKTDNENYKNQT